MPAAEQPDSRAKPAIAPGQMAGPYRIEAFLGAGGMGEVHRASDARLGRVVALKFLTKESDSVRRSFQREARAASALNHPNICTVYDVGDLAGRPALPNRSLAASRL